MKQIGLALAVVLSAGTALAGGLGDGVLRVEVTGIRGEKGQIGCLLFSQPKGFPNDNAAAKQAVLTKIEGGRAACTFVGVTAGDHAISVLHDENGNGKMDSSFLGAPKEGYGFSNGAKAHTFSPPSFEEARISYTGAGKAIVIPVTYP
jgi:uncharacterized protein (DUF2141 family)